MSECHAFTPNPDQVPPGGDWSIWTLCAGHGAGKTRAGIEWLLGQAEQTPESHWGIVAPAEAPLRYVLDEVFSVCRQPPKKYSPTLHLVRLANGAEVHGFSIARPGALRGYSLNGVLLDEIGAWDEARAWAAWQSIAAAVRRPPARIVTTVQEYAPPMIQWLHGGVSNGHGIQSIVKRGVS
jgi:phage terminase large subunit-like protein